MNVTVLLLKLLEIEKSIGIETDMAILAKIFEAESCLLEMQKQIESLHQEPSRDAIRRVIDAAIAA